MAVMGTTLVFRPDGDDRGGRSRRWHPRASRVRSCGRRSSWGSPGIKRESAAAKRGAGSGKFLLVGAVLAIQFVGAAAISSKVGGDIRVEFKMPKEAEVGSSIELRCEWQILGGSNLYSVKWYKDDHEFFRYMPDSDQRTQIFPRPGVKVEPRPNNEQKWIRLRDLGLESSGQYKCEVSTEAPSFATTYQTANLTVISLPERGPEITGLSMQYAVGENVTANCSAWPSVPKANLRWTINGEPVPLENVVQHPPLAPLSTGDIPNSLGLRLEVEHRHFTNGGQVRIKCIAQVGSRMYDVERSAMKAYVNNQRLSAGDIHAGARSIRPGFLTPLLTAILALVLLTT
ncbi:uncharacterized protein LOC105833168 [Monomorium pharaonis]|uniref:uncharacterized protein LOC105833168 n=1 Tax=Monomorium pharaonis TaxID=307658 RepID=UPI00063F33AA|nr:uncharacterized protein LOC105833168 [Monomorium pharaonis]